MYRLCPTRWPRLTFSVLVCCAALGPLSIDILTPSLPAMASAFATTADKAQWAVSLFMLGFALSLILVGPLAEAFGKRRVLLAGYSVYLLATLVILQAQSITVLLAARLVQALAGCFGTALSRTLAREYYGGKDESEGGKSEIHVLGLLGSIMVLVPTLAPLSGWLPAGILGLASQLRAYADG